MDLYDVSRASSLVYSVGTACQGKIQILTNKVYPMTRRRISLPGETIQLRRRSGKVSPHRTLKIDEYL